jgi:hypothetical protein
MAEIVRIGDLDRITSISHGARLGGGTPDNMFKSHGMTSGSMGSLIMIEPWLRPLVLRSCACLKPFHLVSSDSRAANAVSCHSLPMILSFALMWPCRKWK